MLVLSRNENQGISFPGLGVSVSILEVAGNKVKIGVDAPIEVRILRDELMGSDQIQQEDAHRSRLPQAMRHELRIALNEIRLRVKGHLNRLDHEPQSVDLVERMVDDLDVDEMFRAIIGRLESVENRGQLPSMASMAGRKPLTTT